MKINEETKYLIRPIAFIVLLTLLVIATLFFGASQYVGINAKTKEITQTRKQLSEKVSVLENIPEQFSGDTSFLNVVLPENSSVLYALSQIKSVANANALSLTNIESSTPVTQGKLSVVYVSFDVEGENSSLFVLLNAIPKMLPLMSLDKVKTVSSTTTTKSTLMIKVYSSELPKTLPSLSTANSTFTNEEIKMLDELSSYKLPTFFDSGPKSPVVKEDPFSN